MTGLAKLKAPYEVRERVGSHSLGKLEKTYNLHDYDDEKAATMQKWATYLNFILAGRKEAGKVVNIFDCRK